MNGEFFSKLLVCDQYLNPFRYRGVSFWILPPDSCVHSLNKILFS